MGKRRRTTKWIPRRGDAARDPLDFEPSFTDDGPFDDDSYDEWEDVPAARRPLKRIQSRRAVRWHQLTEDEFELLERQA